MCFSQKQSGIFAKKSDTYKYNKSFLYEAIPFFIIKIKFNHPVSYTHLTLPTILLV